MKKCLGIDVQSNSKYKKSNLIYVQNYLSKKLIHKISFLPEELDNFINDRKNIDVKNMYLKRSKNYIFMKARKRNHLTHVISRNLNILEEEFYNRLGKI